MTGKLAGIVLAAGKGSRLSPLTELRPKALCPVNNEPLLDRALRHLHPFVAQSAINAHHLADQIVERVADRCLVNVEQPVALGTAGAIGGLRDWIGDRDVLLHNADAWHDGSLDEFVGTWSGKTSRLLVHESPEPSDFDHYTYRGVALLPNREVQQLEPTPSGLYEALWAESWARDKLECFPAGGRWYDCGTPASYLGANLYAGGGGNVIGAGCIVEGEISESVLWPGVTVSEDETLHRVIRATDAVTVQC